MTYTRQRRAKERLRRERGASGASGACVTIRRVTEADGATVWVVSDEGGEFARASLIADALDYTSDLLYELRGTEAAARARERAERGEPPPVS